MRLLCFGDSNTYGFDPRDFSHGRYAPGDRWPDLLARHSGWTVINQGVNGRQIPRNPYALRLLKESGPVDLFLVMLGTNDLLQGARAAEAAARMEVFLTQLHPHCPNVLLISPPPMQRGAWVGDDALVTESRLLGQEYAHLAQKLEIPHVDTSDWEIELAYDGVHFTEDGHHSFARHLSNYFQK